ncbi:MAG: methyltransferase domain-containing protein [Sedimentisphaerales bacterium]
MIRNQDFKFKLRLEEILVCPICNGDLAFDVVKQDNLGIEEGIITCLSCKQTYLINEGIFDFWVGEKEREGNKGDFWSQNEFEKLYQRTGYYENDYEWRDKQGVPRQVTDYDYPLIEGRLLEWLKPHEGDIILDVGCGVGDKEFAILDGYSLDLFFIGVEISRNRLKSLIKRAQKEKYPIVPILADAEKLPIRTQKMDLVLCTEVLEHIFDKKRALREMSRVLKNRGRLLLSTPSRFAESFWSNMYGIILNLLHFWKIPKKILGRLFPANAAYSEIAKKKRERAYDNPLFSWELRKLLRSNNFNILNYELNVIIPERNVFRVLPHSWSVILLRICSFVENNLKFIFKFMALHIVTNSEKINPREQE